ncbi:DUF3653 domain-containing protein [Xanthomonas massiliensis]|uniref:DUF3653 domain-containing protein n=1 Tax=Xanthomonas massiliensis TaxID=1720302 RepID=UPI00098EC98B|nr:DUF3653 domain-containing protein [Xanthomonas massiliensis]
MRNQKMTGRWAGFSFDNDALVTPEGRRLLPEDLAWISLTAALAQEWRRMMEEKRACNRVTRRDAGTASVILLRQALNDRARG